MYLNCRFFFTHCEETSSTQKMSSDKNTAQNVERLKGRSKYFTMVFQSNSLVASKKTFLGAYFEKLN